MFIIKEIYAWIFGLNFDSVLKYLLLAGDISNSSITSESALNISGILQVSNNICNYVIMPIADCLLVMYFLFHLIEAVSNENFTFAQFGKALAKVIIYHIVIINTFSFMMMILSTGNSLLVDINSKLASVTTSETSDITVPSVFLGDVQIMPEAASRYTALIEGSDTAYAPYEALEGKTGISNTIKRMGAMIDYIVWYVKNALPEIIYLIVPFVISVICYGSMVMAALSRVLQIAIRLPFAPISLADMYNGGIHSQGMRSFKGIFALAIQGAVIIIIIAIGNVLCSTIYAGSADNIFMGALLLAVVKLAQISLLGKSLDISKEILGA